MKVGIINVTGYAGMELARILLRHPEAEITSITGRSMAGKDIGEVFPHLAELDMTITEDITESVDVVFSALPHAASAGSLAPLIRGGGQAVAAPVPGHASASGVDAGPPGPTAWPGSISRSGRLGSTAAGANEGRIRRRRPMLMGSSPRFQLSDQSSCTTGFAPRSSMPSTPSFWSTSPTWRRSRSICARRPPSLRRRSMAAASTRWSPHRPPGRRHLSRCASSRPSRSSSSSSRGGSRRP